MNNDNKIIYAFIDASNLFYGGRVLGWKIDYQKLLIYLKNKYNCSRILFYGGIETHGFNYSIIDYYKPIDLDELIKYLEEKMHDSKLEDKDIILINRHLKQIKFYRKLRDFGYEMKLKPTKSYIDRHGEPIKKANCDVDMTFDIMRLMGQYNDAVVISGDGDFIPVLSYLKHKGREVIVLAHPKCTSRDLKKMLKNNFQAFTKLKRVLEFLE